MKKYVNLYRMRRRKNITLKKMSEIIGVTKQYIWDIESGRRTLSYKMAFRISAALDMTPDEVFLEDFKRE